MIDLGRKRWRGRRMGVLFVLGLGLGSVWVTMNFDKDGATVEFVEPGFVADDAEADSTKSADTKSVYAAVVAAEVGSVQEEPARQLVGDPDRPSPNRQRILQSYDCDYDQFAAIFEKPDEYLRAELIKVPHYEQRNYDLSWKFLPLHVEKFRSNPLPRYIPRLRRDSRLTPKQFVEWFMMRSQPVVVPFEAMVHLGWTAKALTLKRALEMYPERSSGSSGPTAWRCADGNYPWNAVAEAKHERWPRSKHVELDLGPGLRSLRDREQLRGTTKLKGREGRKHFNFPRNFKLPIAQLSVLNLTAGPPFLDARLYQDPSVWLASASSVTSWHHDCCDNLNAEIMGTKRWILAPPTDAKHFYGRCGTRVKKKGFCVAGVGIKSWSFDDIKHRSNYVLVDLAPGEAGWFHAVERPAPARAACAPGACRNALSTPLPAADGTNATSSDGFATLSVNFWLQSSSKSPSGRAFVRARDERCMKFGEDAWKCK